MTRNPVVHKNRTPSKQQFQTAVAEGLRSLRRKFESETAFANALGMTTAGIRKVYNGGLTCPKRLWDALALDENFLDEIAALYRMKVVPIDMGEGKATPTVCALLHEMVEAEADGIMTEAELLEMDDELAAVEKIVGTLREKVRAVKRARERVAEMVS